MPGGFVKGVDAFDPPPPGTPAPTPPQALASPPRSILTGDAVISSGRCNNCGWHRQALLHRDGTITRTTGWGGTAGQKAPKECHECREWLAIRVEIRP